MGCVWGIRERKCGGDITRRMMMSESMVESILMYGAETWGWKEQEELEKVQEKYFRRVLGVERETPGYVVRDECKRKRLRVQAGESAAKFDYKVDGRDRMLEEKKKQGEGEREILPKKRVCQ
jgi:hypothetical protein